MSELDDLLRATPSVPPEMPVTPSSSMDDFGVVDPIFQGIFSRVWHSRKCFGDATLSNQTFGSIRLTPRNSILTKRPSSPMSRVMSPASSEQSGLHARWRVLTTSPDVK
jgi:hypothetical protein